MIIKFTRVNQRGDEIPTAIESTTVIEINENHKGEVWVKYQVGNVVKSARILEDFNSFVDKCNGVTTATELLELQRDQDFNDEIPF